MEIKKKKHEEAMEKYLLTKEVYYMTIWFIRTYWDMQDELEMIIESSPANDGQPRGSGKSDPTANMALRIEQLHDNIMAIEKALAKIPVEYQKGILLNIIARKQFSNFAAKNTWKKWKHRFVYYVAVNKKFTEE